MSHLSMDEVFAADGLLAEALATFKPREQQLEMAEAVTNAIEKTAHAVIEAGTGTGKTFAYLVPALLSNQKVVISTATKTLQDQIFEKDLPQIAKILGVPSIIALLKGRRNYLCKYRLHQLIEVPQHLNVTQQKELEKIKIWAQVTKTGDISELHSVAESASIWGFVTSSPEVCSVKTCGAHSGSEDLCFATKARRKAMAADVVIVNHHLLLADTKLKEEGFGDLLPEADVVVVDEAHQLADLATQIFGTQWSATRVLRWFRDAQLQATKDQQHKIIRDLDALQKQVREVRLALRGKNDRMIWSEAPSAFIEELEGLHHAMRELAESIKVLSDDDDWEQLWKRMRSLMSGLDVFIDEESDIDVHSRIRWIDVTSMGFTIYDTPVEIADQFKALMARYAKSWIFTSATLAVGESFRGFAEPLGVKENTEFVLLDSSFDYPSQSLLMVPNDLPEPSHPHFAQAFTELVSDLIQMSGGGVFLLFTSYRMLNLVAGLIREEYADEIPHTILVQGEMQRASLLNAFREDGNAILLGTSTFWEGVDVPGSALRLVVIDKLPFASPGDPVLSARINSMKQRGMNAFSQLQLPQAVIALKQGVGRLIRDENDYGVMVICDPRLRTKGYGKTFLKSLPPMPRTDSIERVRKFYKFYGHV